MLLLLLGCAPAPLTCSAPGISTYTNNGAARPITECDVDWSCGYVGLFQVECDNTASPRYACDWHYMNGARVEDGTFSSPDFCEVDEGRMRAEIEEQTGVGITVE